MALICKIDDKVQRDHYPVRLRYANEQSQKQGVKALFERAKQVLPVAESWRRRQLQPLIDTRNFLNHWGEATKDGLESWDLWFALNRMRVVLEVSLYLEPGDRPPDDLSRGEFGLSRTGVHGVPRDEDGRERPLFRSRHEAQAQRPQAPTD